MELNEVLPVVVRDRADTEPDRVFLQHVDGSEWTFSTLHDQALRWAGALHELGVGPGDPVAVMMANGFDAIAIWIGLGWLKAYEVPLNTSYRGRLLAGLTAHTEAKVAIVGGEYLERFTAVGPDMPAIERLVVVGEGEAVVDRALGWAVAGAGEVCAAATPVERDAPAPWDIATILHTSGTTGISKGVLNPWAQIHATAFGNVPRSALGPDDAWYSPLPLFHIGGKLVVQAMAVVGGRMVIRDRFSTGEFWNDVRRFGCTTTILIGTTAAFIGNLPRTEADADNPLRNLHMAPLPDDPEDWRMRFGVRLTSSYNMTEISCAVWTQWDIPHPKTCGRPRKGYDVRIVDEHDREVPAGEVGELVVRADDPWVLMAGYYKRPEATAQAWRNLWFHTGDLARRDEQRYFYYLDRVKDSIRRRGENISSLEVENELNLCDQVLECAVVGVPSELGEEEVKVVVVPRDPATFSPQALIDFAVERLPDFMVPRYVEIAGELPRTPTEKIRKQALRDSGTVRAWDRSAVAA